MFLFCNCTLAPLLVEFVNVIVPSGLLTAVPEGGLELKSVAKSSGGDKFVLVTPDTFIIPLHIISKEKK